ncbi:hypothetical protein ES703_65656 [subsurface metagenome]
MKMMNTIRVPQLAWYGAKELALPLPDSWQVEVCNMTGYHHVAMKPDEIRTALGNPIGTPPIRELAKGKEEVVIIVDDMTRVTRAAEIVPFVLEELAEAGIPDNRIRFIVALGCHGALNRVDFAKKLGEETLARFPVYNHNAFGNCVYVGTTSYDTKLYINEEVMRCDLKIAIGSVVPHPHTGFGGGGKIILPGVCSFGTIVHFHRQEFIFREKYPDRRIIGMGVIDENPLRLNVAEAVAIAGLDVKIDCLINMWGETVAIFAGAPKPAYAAAVGEAISHYLTSKTEVGNVVIANTFAKANESIIIGLHAAFSGVAPEGGDVVLISNAPDGQVTHYLLGSFGRNSGGPLRLQMKIPEHVNRVIIYSEYPDITGGQYIEQSDKVLFLYKWDDVLQVLQETHGADTKVIVYPNAEIQYRV